MILSLENACARVMESHFSTGRNDMDGLYWQRKFQNIATPVSLALAECKGPRQFHYHYKHRADDHSILQPVMGNPLHVLAQACKEALKHAETELVGIQDEKIVRLRNLFESSLRGFLAKYK